MTKVFLEKDNLVAELKEVIHGNLEWFVLDLLPGGKRRGNQIVCGSVAGEPGESLKVTISGDDIGLWKDFATMEGGDVISLFAASKGFNIKTQFKEILVEMEKLYLSKHYPEHRSYPEQVNYTPPKQDYGLPTLYTYEDASEKPVFGVRRIDFENGRKNFVQFTILENQSWVAGIQKDHPLENKRPLYNLQRLLAPHDGELIYIVEGEKCADLLTKLGVIATTSMGGSSAVIDKIDWSPLKGRQVILWPDNDEVGFKYMEKLKAHLMSQYQVSAYIIREHNAQLESGYDVYDMFIEKGEDVVKKYLSQLQPETIFGNWNEKGILCPSRYGIPIEQEELKKQYAIYGNDNQYYLEWGGIGVIAGVSKSRKTTFALNLAMHVACGKPFLNRFFVDKPTKTFLFQLENIDSSLVPLINPVFNNMSLEEQQLVRENLVCTVRLNPNFELGNKEQEAIIKELFVRDKLDCKDSDCLFVVIDPLYWFMGGDEAKNKDVNEFINTLKYFAKSLAKRVAIVIVHHLKKFCKKDLEDVDVVSLVSGGSSLIRTSSWTTVIVDKSMGKGKSELVCNMNGRSLARTSFGLEYDGNFSVIGE